ncbi:MAG: hypothetical protein IJ509_03080 [Bacilli bacterium]|nr:hypothetical protein [Bacilli bacterium]
MKRIKRNKKKSRYKLSDRNKYKNLQLILGGVLFGIIGFFSYQIWGYYQCQNESNRLNSLRDEYEDLMEDIEVYKQLISQYEIILKEGTDLESNKKVLEDKVNALKKDIESLESKIGVVNRKIKDLS